MKVLIAVDYEGVAGMVTWDSNDNRRMREFITADANAAAAGCFDAGAEEVLITEAHANMRNLIPEELDERARYLSGQPKPLNHVAGVDESFDAAMFVAYHARSGALRGRLHGSIVPGHADPPALRGADRWAHHCLRCRDHAGGLRVVQLPALPGGGGAMTGPD